MSVVVWPTTALEPGLGGCSHPFSSLLPEPSPFTVRLLPGQPVREEDFAQNLRSGGIPQQDVCGPTRRWSTRRLTGFTAGLAECARNIPPVLNDLFGGIHPHRVGGSGFTLLVERLLSLPAKGAAPQPLTSLLGPNGAHEIAHFINSAVLPTEEAADLSCFS